MILRITSLNVAHVLQAMDNHRVYFAGIGRLTVMWSSKPIPPNLCTNCGEEIAWEPGCIEAEQPRYHDFCVYKYTCPEGGMPGFGGW